MKDPEMYTEEIYLDGNVYKHQSVFSPNSTYVASITGRFVIVYDVKTGKRQLILNGDFQFCGLKWQDENTLLTISREALVNIWDLKAGESVSQFSLNFEGFFFWTYNVEDSVFAVALSKDRDQLVLRLNLDNGSTEICAKLPVRIKHRRAIFPSEQFVLYCNGRTLAILPYKGVEMSTNLEYKVTIGLPGLSLDSIEFSSVTMVNNNVFAVLNFGRVLYWRGVKENGLSMSQKEFIHGHYTEPCIAVSSLLAIFFGTANSRVEKWHSVTAGSGRYERFQVMERMDAPVEALWLSPDSNYLLAILSDNSMIILNTVSLAVVSRPPTLHWPAFYKPTKWLGICTDIEHPDYVLTNTRTGYIQWVDPTKWRTFGEFDVSKENPPPRDCFNFPKYNWTNVYAASCTSSIIVTAECRRDDAKNHVIKFFYRLTPGATYDMKQIGCITLKDKVKFLRSNMEEVRHDPSERALREHYVLAIDYCGNVKTFYPNPYESYRWTVDLRRNFNWQQTTIKSCSTIRSNLMATVNSAQGSDDGVVVLIWDTEIATVTDFIDSVASVRQTCWCPPQKHREFVLLIASKDLITAYDADAKNFLWAVMEPVMNVYANLFTVVAYKGREVYLLNQRDGSISKRLELTHIPDKIVATGNASNIRLSCLDVKGLILLKPDIEENLTLRDIEIFTKSTPFSALIRQARADSQPASTKQQLHRIKVLSARKLLEGSAYSLAPITKLAPAYVNSCLVARAS